MQLELDEIVLIDDDKLVHMSWDMDAKKVGKAVRHFYSVEKFFEESSSLPCNVTIYIDSDLGDGIRGEVESKRIFEAGFKNIHLATGFPLNSIEKPKWIISIQGKRFPSLKGDA